MIDLRFSFHCPGPKWMFLHGSLWAALQRWLGNLNTWSLIPPSCTTAIFKMGLQGVTEGIERRLVWETFVSRPETGSLGPQPNCNETNVVQLYREDCYYMWWIFSEAVLWAPENKQGCERAKLFENFCDLRMNICICGRSWPGICFHCSLCAQSSSHVRLLWPRRL